MDFLRKSRSKYWKLADRFLLLLFPCVFLLFDTAWIHVWFTFLISILFSDIYLTLLVDIINNVIITYMLAHFRSSMVRCVCVQDLSQLNIGTNRTDLSLVQSMKKCIRFHSLIRLWQNVLLQQFVLTDAKFIFTFKCLFFFWHKSLATRYNWTDSTGDNIFTSDSLCRYLFYTFMNGSVRRILVNSFKF